VSFSGFLASIPDILLDLDFGSIFFKEQKKKEIDNFFQQTKQFGKISPKR
jgi:hypothetical protein